ncbi:GNAT family N-acetyltransferase [Ensifer sp.]|jgi:GNAT superfamily N-acetyltransferase|uniref:GNAT family N-acetyltransferase n=1 Tax=Ensifer sp. TaxID=1872086 RepID=UPI002E11EB1D|nr:GNAT family N-acetyltransferase [Ensifer sp.]
MKTIRRIDIRPAGPDDIMMIASVIVETWRSTFRGLISDAFLDAMTIEEQALRHARRMRVADVFHMVAVDMGTNRVIGFANYGKARSMPPRFDRELYALYVLEEYQGAGIGSALVRSAAAHCRELGGKSLFAWVLSSNPNRAFYEHLGAAAVGQGQVSLGGENHEQTAYRWNDLAKLSGKGRYSA